MAFVVGEVAAPVTADPSVFNRVMREVQQKGASVTQYTGQQWEKVSKQMAGEQARQNTMLIDITKHRLQIILPVLGVPGIMALTLVFRTGL